MINPFRDRNRKLLGLAEPDSPADPEVLQRRKYHAAAAKWLAQWFYPLQGVFAAIGFFVVLLPMFSTSWRTAIENTFIASRIFHDFSTLSGWAMVLFAILMIPFLILTMMGNVHPGGWDTIKQSGHPNPKDVAELELYPRTKREELMFWISAFSGAVGTAAWLILPFGIFAFIMRIGS